MSLKNSEILERLREIFSNISIKTYLYAIGATGMIILIIWNTHQNKAFITETNDGKVILNIAKVAKDYGLDISDNSTDDNLADYTDTNTNLTKDLSNSLYITNLYMNQNGLTDPTARGKILANIILEYQKSAQGKVYTDNDLNIIRNTDKASLEDYANSLGQALNDYNNSLNNLPDSNFNNISNVTEDQLVTLKGQISAQILQNIDINNNLINTLISIPATTDGAAYQLQLINLISQENIFLKSIAYIDTDPMKYILTDGENFQQKFTTDLQSILDSFNNYFEQNGITNS